MEMSDECFREEFLASATSKDLGWRRLNRGEKSAWMGEEGVEKQIQRKKALVLPHKGRGEKPQSHLDGGPSTHPEDHP